MRIIRLLGACAAVSLLVASACRTASAEEGFVTTTFGNADFYDHAGTLKVDKDVMRFDLSALPGATNVLRAELRVPTVGRRRGRSVQLVAINLGEAAVVPTRPPAHTSFEMTPYVSAWVAGMNNGLRIVEGGGLNFRDAVLEVSYIGKIDRPPAGVSDLKAEHRSGQTFLTWTEQEDVVAADAPTFEQFEKAVLQARRRREVVYRVYRHDRPIAVANLADAQLVREAPEVLSGWNLLAVANTEHSQKGKTKRSPLRGGNLVLSHVMTRYRLGDGAEPLPRTKALAVFTAAKAGRRYYAVTRAVDGREAVVALKRGANATGTVEETPAPFPAVIHQRSRKAPPKHRRQPDIDVFVCWLEPPHVTRPRPVEVYLPRWKDLPAGSPENRLPLFVNLGTYGGSASTMSSPVWHGARRYVQGAVTVGLAEEGRLWAGQHECLGTLRGYEQGVIWNYGQRRVLAVTRWAIQRPDLFIDPERVYIWGQFAGWALRHADLYAVVMSNGHNNFKTSREARKHGWKWGPSEGEKGNRNWLGVSHWDYLDLATWVRENPAVELPYWICAPAYGAFPSHTLGDFGFKPWQEFITAMKDTRRAFAAVWTSNGPGLTNGVMHEMAPRIRLHQSLPAFSNGSLDSSPFTEHPRGESTFKHDPDFVKFADKAGGINLYLRWQTDNIVDQPDRWEMTVFLAGKDNSRHPAPADRCTVDLTPRRGQKFKPAPGEEFRWTNTSLAEGKVVQSGAAKTDRWGLLTVPKLTVGKTKNRIAVFK